MSLSDRQILDDILIRIEKLRPIASLTQEAYLQDDMMKTVVERHLEIIGDLVKGLSSDFRTQHTEIPWKEVAKLRDLLAHHYERIDHVELWNTLTLDVPILEAFIKRVMDDD
jgi:uncharacterized protein with HEPN domain